jgi:hypothetical protein
MAEQHGERRQQNGGQCEAAPGQLQPQPAAWDRLRTTPAGCRSTTVGDLIRFLQDPAQDTAVADSRPEAAKP